MYSEIMVTNEDGTPIYFEYPQNPLKEKWDKLYPPIPMPQYSQVCDDYSCMWCGRCPNGSNWKVPEEDRQRSLETISRAANRV